MSWRDRDDRTVERPSPPGPDAPAFYAPIGDFQGVDHRRNAFAQHTAHEAEALAGYLERVVDARILDVGCGDGRHLRALARRGVRGIGIDVSHRLLAAARAAAEEEDAGHVAFVRGDARRLPLRTGSVDAAISLCQGGLGTHPVGDRRIVAELARVVRPGGRVAITFFHALFAARHLGPGDAFDPLRLLHHEEVEVRGGDERRSFHLWTATYTAREATALLEGAGFAPCHVTGCEPGRYDGGSLGLDDPEILIVAERAARPA